MVKSWLTFSAIQAKNSSTEAKESNDIQMSKELQRYINAMIREACSKGEYQCSVRYDQDLSDKFIVSIMNTLKENGYTVTKEDYNGGLGKRLVLNWKDVTND